MNSKKLLVINVLAKDTYADCRIKGSINVPFDHLATYAKDLSKDQPIVVYCASYVCPVSTHAWRELHKLGFKNIWAYEGGITEWRQKKLPTEGSCKLSYLQEIYEPAQAKQDIKHISAEELHTRMRKSGLI